VARTVSYTEEWVWEGGLELDNFSKKVVFLVWSGKNKFHHCWLPILEKLLEKSTSGPPGKNLSDTHGQKHVKLHRFCKS